MARIVNISQGLSPAAARQLYLACIVSIVDYGSVIWWKGQTGLIKPLQAIQNCVSRKILGVFKTAPTLPMEVESILVPPKIRLNSNIRQYALRLIKLSKNHPINKELENNRRIHQDLNRPLKSILQLSRIYDSISEFTENLDLEVINLSILLHRIKQFHIQLQLVN
jgi:hypothetical protein